MNTAAGDNPTDDRLDALRRRGDAEADAVAARLAAARPDLDPHQLIRAALDELRRERMRTRVAAAAPTAAGTETTVAAASASMSESTKVVRDWFVTGPQLPEWVDRRRLAHGQQVFGRWSLPIAASLFCASLPFTYAADKGVQVLVLTSDLATNNLHRRIGETAQMLVDVTDLTVGDYGGVTFTGRAYMTARGVRLLHAVIRRSLVGHERWNDEWGHPINQEDLLGTLFAFSIVVFDALGHLGVSLTDDERSAYHHLWNVLGYLLGVDETLLPMDVATARTWEHRIAERQQRGDGAAGRRLMAALLADMELSMPIGLRKLPRSLVRQVLPDAVATRIGVPAAAWWAPALDLVAAIGRRMTRLDGVRRIVLFPLRFVGRAVIRGYIDGAVSGAPPFRVDDELVEVWRLERSRLRSLMSSRRRRARVRSLRGSS